MFIAFVWQQLLHERASMLRYTPIVCRGTTLCIRVHNWSHILNMKKFNPAYKVTLYIKINFKASHALKALPSGIGFSDFVLNCKVPITLSILKNICGQRMNSERSQKSYSPYLALLGHIRNISDGISFVNRIGK